MYHIMEISKVSISGANILFYFYEIKKEDDTLFLLFGKMDG